MNGIIPDRFTVDGNVVISFEKDSLILLAFVVIMIVIAALMAQRFIGKK